MAKLTSDEEARLAALGPTPGVEAPIHLGKDHEVIPEKYIIHYTFTQCKNCGNAVRDSEFFALTYIRSRITGTRVKHLTKCAAPMFNLPVEKLLTSMSKVPYCQACDVIDLSHLPPPPVDSNVTVITLNEPTLRGAKPKPPAAEKKPTTPKKASLDDLI